VQKSRGVRARNAPRRSSRGFALRFAEPFTKLHSLHQKRPASSKQAFKMSTRKTAAGQKATAQDAGVSEKPSDIRPAVPQSVFISL